MFYINTLVNLQIDLVKRKNRKFRLMKIIILLIEMLSERKFKQERNCLN